MCLRKLPEKYVYENEVRFIPYEEEPWQIISYSFFRLSTCCAPASLAGKKILNAARKRESIRGYKGTALAKRSGRPQADDTQTTVKAKRKTGKSKKP